MLSRKSDAVPVKAPLVLGDGDEFFITDLAFVQPLAVLANQCQRSLCNKAQAGGVAALPVAPLVGINDRKRNTHGKPPEYVD